jgi:prepilin signal peptidase PulO-like enzyme (type II secretory pathway)
MPVAADTTGGMPATTPSYTYRVPPGVVAVLAVFVGAGAFIANDVSLEGAVAGVLCAVLVVLAAIDLERHVIPNVIVLPSAVFVYLGNVVADSDSALEYGIAAAAAFAGGAIISLATRGGVGMGDAKLCLLLGAGLGWALIGALIVGTFAAALVGIIILVRRGMGARKDAIPFGPFLAFGGILAAYLA